MSLAVSNNKETACELPKACLPQVPAACRYEHSLSLSPIRKGEDLSEPLLQAVKNENGFAKLDLTSLDRAILVHDFSMIDKRGKVVDTDGALCEGTFSSQLTMSGKHQFGFKADDGRCFKIDIPGTLEVWLKLTPSAKDEATDLVNSVSALAGLEDVYSSEGNFKGTILNLGRLTGNPEDILYLGADIPRHIEVSVSSVRELLYGDEVEFFNFGYEKDEKLKPLDYWESPYDVYDAKPYLSVIYPAVRNYIEAFLSNHLSPSCKAVDLLGGNGSFANGLKSVLEDKNIKLDVSVLDQSDYSKEQCQLKGIPHIHGNISTDKLQCHINGQVELITCIGGLTKEVVTRETALRAAAEVFDVLAPGGFFVLSGRTAQRLTSKDFRSIGYEVLNTAARDNREHRVVAIQLYALRKPL